MEQFDSIYWRGQGPALLAYRDSAGNSLGFEFSGDIEDISGDPSVSKTNVKENVTGNRLTAAIVKGETSFPITINFKSLKPEHAATILQADLTARAAGSVTGEVATAYQGKFIKLAHIKCSNIVVGTHVAGTDYISYGDEGMIEVLSAGIADEDVLSINYDYAAQKHLSANPGNKEFILTFPGINTANGGKRGRCTIFKLQIDPGFLGLIQPTEEASVSVSAEMLIDSLRPAGNQLYEWDYED